MRLLSKPQRKLACAQVDDSTKFLIVAAISRHELSHQDVQHTIDSIGYEPHDGYLKPKL